jgi:hypothetical protein
VDDLDTLSLGYFVEWFPEAMVSVVDKEAQRRQSGLSGLGQVAGDLSTPPLQSSSNAVHILSLGSPV